jgi:O-acetyl-ADP-ribose deacetylase (regulator of RNase III)
MDVESVEGDITTQDLDAIVNAANSTLLGGGGVDGAIHAAAGPRLLEECRRLRRTSWPDGLPVGNAVATGGGDLAARWVIHTVGPNRHRGQDDPALLAACFTASLDVAAEIGARSVAFPAISAGAYGWAVEDVARIGVAAVRSWGEPAPAAAAENGLVGGSASGAAAVELVRFVLYGARAGAAFRAALAAADA